MDTLGMQWVTQHDTAWQQNFEAVRHYKKQNGHLNVLVGYVSEDGYRVDKWLRHQRDSYKAKALSVERTEKLATIGMKFIKENPWEHEFNLTRTYYKEHGNLNMKSNKQVKTTKALNLVHVKKLETIGIRRE